MGNPIASRPSMAVRPGEEAVNHAFNPFLAHGVADAPRTFFFLFSTEDRKEGMRGFSDNRKPEGKGEVTNATRHQPRSWAAKP